MADAWTRAIGALAGAAPERADLVRRVAPSGYEIRELSAGWELASSAPGAHQAPDSLPELGWQAAVVPGTVAASVGET